jgi:hypothetical protein
LANSYLVANGPNVVDDQGNPLGPYSFGFLLDEAPQLPKLDTVINGPSVGRSKKVFYAIVGQDYGQFEQKYSKPEVETLKSTTALKVILSQNNEATAKAVSEASGKTTYVKQNISDGEKKKMAGMDGMFGDMFSTKKKNSSESFEATEFLKSSFIMSLPPGKHLVQVQNFMNRPVLCDTPRFFDDKNLRKLVYNLRDFSGPAPAPPMPLAMMDTAAERKRTKPAEAEAARKAAADSGRHILVATPRDLQALTRDVAGKTLPRNDLYAAWPCELKDDTEWLDTPDDSDIFVTNDPAEIQRMVGEDRVICFDAATLREEINDFLEEAEQPTIRADRLLSIAEFAIQNQEEPGDDIYQLGWQGAAALNLPDNPEKVSPQFTLHWMAETMTYLLGVRSQARLYTAHAGSQGAPGTASTQV